MLEEEKEKSILHLLIFLLFFLPDFPKFLILSFFFVFLFREFPLDTLLVLANWWKISFPSSEIVLMFPSFLKDIFSGCKILGWVLFSFNSWKILHHLFVTCIIFVMKFIVIKIVFPPKERYHFAVAVFKIFSLPLVFRSLIVMCLGMDCFDLFFLVIIQRLEGLVYISCQIWTFLSHYFFEYFFILALSPFFLWL